MKKLGLAIIAATVLAGCSKESAASAPADAETVGAAPATRASVAVARTLPQGVHHVQKVSIPDPSGFGQPMIAASALIPVGWTSQGGVVWGPHGQCGADFAYSWTAQGPEGSAFSIIPVKHWTGVRTKYPSDAREACPPAFWASAREYLEAMAQQMHPGARTLDWRPRPDEAKPIQDVLDQFPPINNQNMQVRWRAEAGELLIAYNDNGRDMRAILSAAISFNDMRMSDVINPGDIAMETITGIPEGLAVVRAPDGRLDFGLRKRVLTSVRTTPEWGRNIAAYVAKRNADRDKAFVDGMNAGHAARMDALAAASAVINGNYQDRELTNDRMRRENIEAIRGVETYHDPLYGGPVQLDATYDHAWRVSNSDSYILTDNPNFNPGQHNIEAQELKVVQ